MSEKPNSQGATGCLEVDCDNTPETCGVGCGKHKQVTPQEIMQEFAIWYRANYDGDPAEIQDDDGDATIVGALCLGFEGGFASGYRAAIANK